MTKKNILFITVDALRYDCVNEVDMPFLTAISKTWKTFTKAYTNEGHTSQAFQSLFETEFIINLVNQGYYTIGITHNPWISKHYGYDYGFDVFKDFRDLHEEHFLPNSFHINEYFRKIMKDESTREPWFCWLHYMDCHTPYYPHYKLDERMLMADSGTPLMPITPKLIKSIKDDYLYAVRHVDKNVQILHKTLHDMHIFKNTNIIITADHGEEFMEHGRFSHQAGRHTEELLHIPLIVKGLGNSISTKKITFKDIHRLFPSLMH